MSESITSLQEINTSLKRLGLPGQMTLAHSAKIKSAPGATEKFLRALRVANTDNNARSWLVRQLTRLGIMEASPVPATTRPRAASAHTSAAATPVSAGSGEQRDFTSFHVYGKQAALCFSADVTRSGFHTISLDAAITNGERSFEWENKIRIQITRAELPMVCAVLLGYLPKTEFYNHGTEKNKGFSIENQGANFFVRVVEKELPMRAVPMNQEDAFYVTGLVLRQLGRAFEGGAAVPIELMLQRYARLKIGGNAPTTR